MSQQRLDSTTFGGELLPFKREDMTPERWYDVVNKQHIFLGQRFLLLDIASPGPLASLVRKLSELFIVQEDPPICKLDPKVFFI